MMVKKPSITGIFFTLKVANVKPPKVFLGAVGIMKLAGGIVEEYW